ncbi:hypothetical protein ACJROX_27180 [Pseudalkalibacillus sp. A8]|uniref:hypothetical protein n=1 Tax=Pseudalkalibacillus sp. A8 TaxID=3382641 RepID=UPI0038B46BDD
MKSFLIRLKTFKPAVGSGIKYMKNIHISFLNSEVSRILSRYRLLSSTLLLAGLMCLTLWASNFSNVGAGEYQEPPANYRVTFVNQSLDSISDQWIDEHRQAILIGRIEMLDEMPSSISKTMVYPIYDQTISEPEFNERYPLLPDSVSGFYKTAYSTDFGDIRLFVLNGSKLTDQRQWEWLEQESQKNNKKKFQLLFVDGNLNSSMWERLRKMEIDAVFMKDQLNVRSNRLEAASIDWDDRTSDWRRWKGNDILSFEIMASEDDLTIQAESPTGAIMQKVVIHHLSDQHQMKRDQPFATYGSVWQYRLGDESIPITVPSNIDLTGEHPITERVNLPVSDWRHQKYIADHWKTGRAPIGSKDAPTVKEFIQTPIPAGRTSSVYFRQSFTVTDPKQLQGLRLHVTFADGFVAYLNGEEIERDGIKPGLTTPETLAVTNEPTFQKEYRITSQLNKLVPGTNTLTIEVHKSHPHAKELIFDATLIAETIEK